MYYDDYKEYEFIVENSTCKNDIDDAISQLEMYRDIVQEEINQQDDCYVDWHDELEHLENLIELGQKRLGEMK